MSCPLTKVCPLSLSFTGNSVLNLLRWQVVDCTCTWSLLQWFLLLTYGTVDPIRIHDDDLHVALHKRYLEKVEQTSATSARNDFYLQMKKTTNSTSPHLRVSSLFVWVSNFSFPGRAIVAETLHVRCYKDHFGSCGYGSVVLTPKWSSQKETLNFYNSEKALTWDVRFSFFLAFLTLHASCEGCSWPWTWW